MVGFLLGRCDLERALRDDRCDDAAWRAASSRFPFPASGDRDEIGEMAGAVEVFRNNMAEAERLRAEQSEADARQRTQRKADMQRLADTFEGAVGEIIETVSSAATELEASSNTLTQAAERGSGLASAVAAASEEASANVQSVSSASEEMTSSISEISRQVQESARVADVAVEQAQRTNARVAELTKAAGRIGDVVELINTIAGQTNLLALNATIEAARAGEAGKGFAVVATEVKALAEQTAKATGEIGQHIGAIQTATQDSVGADQGDRRHHRADVGDFVDHRSRRRRAGRRHPGDLPQYPARRPRVLRTSRRTSATFSVGRARPERCLGAGACGRAVAVAGEQPAEERGRAFPGLGAGGVICAYVSIAAMRASAHACSRRAADVQLRRSVADK